MKKGKYFRNAIIAFMTCFAILLGSVHGDVLNIEAKVTYIKTLKIAQGNKYTLTIKGKKGKIKWSSNKKKIAKVNSSGKVTALKKGVAKVSGKVGGKKYTTTVTVYNAGGGDGNVSLTDVSSGSGGSATISGSFDSALSQVGNAIANRNTSVTVNLNARASAGEFTNKLFSSTSSYVNDYDYLSLRKYSYSASSDDDGTTINYTFYYRITASYNNKLKAKVKSIAKSISGSDAAKVKAIHKYIVNHATYVDGGYTAYNCLIDGGSVCEGYALSFYELCKAVGVDCRVVTGTAYGSKGSGNHAWNVVKVNGTWYNMDVTWDDTTDSNNYYLKSNSDFAKHYPDSRSNAFLSGMNRA